MSLSDTREIFYKITIAKSTNKSCKTAKKSNKSPNHQLKTTLQQRRNQLHQIKFQTMNGLSINKNKLMILLIWELLRKLNKTQMSLETMISVWVMKSLKNKKV